MALKLRMTGVVSRLERDGMVRRRKSLEDQRRVFVAVTEPEDRAGLRQPYLTGDFYVAEFAPSASAVVLARLNAEREGL